MLLVRDALVGLEFVGRSLFLRELLLGQRGLMTSFAKGIDFLKQVVRALWKVFSVRAHGVVNQHGLGTFLLQCESSCRHDKVLSGCEGVEI